MVCFEIGISPYGNLEANLQHCRKLIMKLFDVNHNKSQKNGIEYLTTIALLLRKILDKETDFNLDAKQALFEKIFTSTVLHEACQETGPNQSQLQKYYQQHDIEGNNKIRQLITGKTLSSANSLSQTARNERMKLGIERNRHLANSIIKSGIGTRVMRIGENHLNSKLSMGQNLDRFLNDAGFATIILSA